MINPILKVLSALSSRNVRCLLIGGQACIFYGAAEFSRDTDIAVLASSENLERLLSALDDLNAVTIAVPPLSGEYLRRGHAVHFRCSHPDALGMRVDVISRMRGVEPFEKLWDRRTTVEITPGTSCELLSLPDLVRSKKTQRDKDWPMIRRLIEADFAANKHGPTPEQIEFWLREGRTPSVLREIAVRYPADCQRILSIRPLLVNASNGNDLLMEEGLQEEERLEREADREYWKPLRQELEQLRHAMTGKRTAGL